MCNLCLGGFKIAKPQFVITGVDCMANDACHINACTCLRIHTFLNKFIKMLTNSGKC